MSVLFVDLVGFTTLSESRDAEDVRELLGHYFERAKTIVSRYGGTVEKFIGDAIMAVWGVPVAREDDAERAVRAGLDLVDAVTVFGQEAGASALRARAGIVTGQVASLANPGEGLIVGDRVNTASRVQSVADPGTVFVDQVTRQVTAASIAYADAGEHEVRGKTEPLHLFRALRTVAGVAGNKRESELEPPFVGRDAELRLLKDLFHASVDRGGARLVGISGPAGVGKTRLGWEFDKYADGIFDSLLWHTGSSLSYGEGVAYWALAEMVRQRLGIAEDAPEREASALLLAGLEEWIPNADERAELAPALGALIGTAEPGLEREELFATWRLFFERLAERDPVVLMFEDMQWADDGLLDFVEHLLQRSAGHPIFVCAFARSELSERRPGWPVNVPGGTSVQLEPLADHDIVELLNGLVADLPGSALHKIVSQAEGVPLYAVETVRALADRGVLTERTGRLSLDGDIGDLDVPASLSSLLSARLDSLAPDERELVRAMAVFGGSFPRPAAAALTDIPDHRLDDVLGSLVRRDIFTIRDEPLSPERGQHAFAQGLLRTVAYEMIAKRDRRPLHVAAAEHLRETFPNDGEDVAEVIASHLLDAYRAGSPEGDGDALRLDALAALRRGAGRASSIGAPETAGRMLQTALELAGEGDERTALLEERARVLTITGPHEAALDLFEQASAAHLAAGRERDAARLAAGMGLELGRLSRNDEAITRMREALEVFAETEFDPGVAELCSELGVALSFGGRPDEALPFFDRALVMAEALELPDVLCRALGQKALASLWSGRFEESGALFDRAIEIGERHRLANRVTVQINAADSSIKRDIPEMVERCEAALATARRLGDRVGESTAIGNLMTAKMLVGAWQEVERLGREALESGGVPDAEFVHYQLALLCIRRGERDAARHHLSAMEQWRDSGVTESMACYRGTEGQLRLAEGDAEPALAQLARAARGSLEAEQAASEGMRLAWPEAVEAALALGRLDAAEELTTMLLEQPRGLVPPLLRGELARATALLATARGEREGIEERFRAAIDGFEKLGYPFELARARTDFAAWMVNQSRGGEATPLLADARAAADQLGAKPLVRRIDELSAVPA